MTYPSFPAPAAPKRRRWITPTIAIGTLVAGFAIGAGASGVATAEAPEPEVITETITEVETVTEIVEVVPGSCLDAITSAREGFTIAAEVMGVVAPAIEAAFYRDIAGMEAATADMDALSRELNSSAFVTHASTCEAVAR